MSALREVCITTSSPDQTRKAGASLGRNLETGDMVFLTGDLGTGKTVFTQGLCHGLGVDENVIVRSPSFAIINEYTGSRLVRHVDLYRVESDDELETVGIFDSGRESVTIIEWADKLKSTRPWSRGIAVTITDLSETQREIRIKGPEEKLENLPTR